jgi:peroxiredoxin
MKSRMFVLLGVALGLFVAVATVQASVSAGSAAPDFALSDLSGQVRRLSDYRGKVVVLEWHNPECPIVGKHYRSGNMQATQRAAESDGVVWLTINSGAPNREGGDYSAAALGQYLQKNGASPSAYLRDPDGKVGHLYGAKTTPHMFVIDKNGVLVYNGAIDSIRSSDAADVKKATNYVSAALADLKASRPVATANTQPYGCAVKY